MGKLKRVTLKVLITVPQPTSKAQLEHLLEKELNARFPRGSAYVRVRQEDIIDAD